MKSLRLLRGVGRDDDRPYRAARRYKSRATHPPTTNNVNGNDAPTSTINTITCLFLGFSLSSHLSTSPCPSLPSSHVSTFHFLLSRLLHPPLSPLSPFPSCSPPSPPYLSPSSYLHPPTSILPPFPSSLAQAKAHHDHHDHHHHHQHTELTIE